MRVKIAVLVALPIIDVMLTGSVVHYVREREVLDRQIGETTHKYSDLIYGSVRQATMKNDHEMLVQITSDSGSDKFCS